MTWITPNKTLVSMLWALACLPVAADITTDGTLGPETALAGPDFVIDQDLGRRAGGNLFHSFKRFGIDSTESATFTGDNDIARVISRVTGGETSNIDGVLRSTIGQADFYFINPAGVIFGPNASIDVPAAFHVGAAGQLRFKDGAVFDAIDLEASTLSISTPDSFGLLNGQQATVTVNGSALDFNADTEVSLHANDIVISSGELVIESGRLVLNAQQELTIDDSALDVSGPGAGLIALQGKQTRISGSEVWANNTGINDALSDTGININSETLVIGTGSIAADADFAGDAADIVIDSGQIWITDGGEITSDSFAQGDAGAIIIDADESMEINRGSITSDAFSTGNAGEILVNAQSLTIDGEGDTASINSDTFDAGVAGDITINVEQLLSIINGGEITSDTFSFSSGDAGLVVVKAGELIIDGQQNESFTGISSDSLLASGHAGEVRIEIEGNLSITNNGVISSDTFSIGDAGNVDVVVDGDLLISRGGAISSDTASEGDAGLVVVKAGELIIDGQQNESFTGISSDSLLASGHAGEVRIEIEGNLSITNNGVISSDTFSIGDAGNVDVVVDGDLLISRGGAISSDTASEGDAGEINVRVGRQLTLNDGGAISSDALAGSIGDAGEITLTTREALKIVNGGLVSSTTFAQGEAGVITVNTPLLTIDGDETGIFSTATEDSFGQAGDIFINAGKVKMANGAEISIESFADIDPAAVDDIVLTQLEVNADKVKLKSGASINAGSSGNVPASFLDINITDLLILDNSTITTSANEADGGDISISGGSTALYDSKITTSVAGQGDGGDIKLDSDVLVLNGGFIQANTEGIGALGGDITNNSQFLISNRNQLIIGGDIPLMSTPGVNVIQAAAPDGLSGLILTTSPEIDISGSISGLSSDLLDLVSIGDSHCRRSGRTSSLVNLGKGGMKSTPALDVYVPTPSLTPPQDNSAAAVSTQPAVFNLDGRFMARWSADDKCVLSQARETLSGELK